MASSRGPLEGRTILVTRPRDQAGELAQMLDKLGAAVLVAPAIDVAPLRSAALTKALADLSAGRFEWVTLTSRATVDVLKEAMRPRDVDAKIAVVGEGTADALARWTNRRPDLMPRMFETQALASSFPRGKGQVLCLRADVAPDGMEEALERKGWAPRRVDAYRTVLARRLPEGARSALLEGRVDAVTFTSASTVRGFFRALAGPPVTEITGHPKIVCIGPVTSKEARAAGLRVAAVASPHTIEGLVAALERALAGKKVPKT
jgi:uroporphyrinogen-III synthase